MGLYLSVDDAQEFINAGWEVGNYNSLYDEDVDAYLVFPRANFLLKAHIRLCHDAIKIHPDDVYALQLLDEDAWEQYLRPLRSPSDS